MRGIEHSGANLWLRAGRALAVVLALAALAAVLASPPSSSADPKYTDGQLKKMLKNELRRLGLSPKGVSSCRPKLGGRVMVCKWRAKGQFEGEVSYECKGKARLNVKSKQWKVDGCSNEIEPMIPLLPTVGPHPLFGYNEAWHLNQGQLDRAAAGGANVARQLLVWAWIERDRGRYDWGLFDGLYHQMLSRGIRPLWVLHAAPCWAHNDACDENRHPPPEHFDELARFAAAAAVRYPEAIGIEIWNEPNYRIYWGGQPDPQEYAAMLREVVPAIEAANPSMTTVTAGLSPHINDVEDAMAYEGFLRKVYEAGGPELADAIGAHPYPNRRPKDNYLGNVRVHMYRYLKVMTEFGEAEKPIWVTETGVSNEGSDENFSHQQQADALVKIYTQFRRIANVPVVIFHRFLDQPGSERIKERGYGVLEGDGKPKPAYCAVARARDVGC